MRIIAIIPARGGSKGIPDKNIKLLSGYPLIAYSICASKLVKNIERTIVSTNSQEISNIAKKYGADVPFLRPDEISQDSSTDMEFIQHAIDWFDKNENAIPELLVELRPTTPMRNPSDIERAITEIIRRPEATSLRTVHELAEPPQKMVKINENGFIEGFFPDDPRPEYYNLPRQMFPKAYHPNGYVDIVRTVNIRKTGSLYGQKILAYITPVVTEVDLPEDFEYLEYQLSKYGNPIYDYLVKNFPKEKRYGRI